MFSVTFGRRHQKLGMKHIRIWNVAANDVEQTDMFAYENDLCLPLLSSLISWRAFSLATFLSMTSLCHPQGNATFVSKTLPSAGGGGGIIHIL